MNFQGLQKIENADFYLDVAIKRMKKRIGEFRQEGMRGGQINKSKAIELTKIESVEKELRDLLHTILISFPSIDSLPEFYRELMSITLEIGLIKKSLGSIKWCIEKNRELLEKYRRNIRNSTEITRINQYRREFFGRLSSTIKQIKKNLEYLEFARKEMKNYPAIKTGLPTVAIAGFPNVGKSTLLSRLTPAKPKIANYAFTTQGINIGYAEIKDQKIQFMDIPGTLARFEKQNMIERVATLALKYVADAVIYVFDPTETYPVEKQIELYELTKKSRKPVIIYLSKTDVAEKDKIEFFKNKYKAITNTEDLKKEIENLEF
ncbi:50S ribosome-binding GTPase [Candidatus Woesearchaeota archaeon]|nr:50S ribosome-binding GTPase [Candidatus Woesearchaeota archaeon]